jgi:hypothetical protein
MFLLNFQSVELQNISMRSGLFVASMCTKMILKLSHYDKKPFDHVYLVSVS